ncbi:hybrid sensor histidine kinase/response regulator [Cognatiluteimonas telluris]|jgi:signal transduction histidine kinase/CheY-like chemotaxis protein|uniref:hybrid sensor histidine kinase/response regulator n=1 Tax=Cognatiluteimonas telluris TaxID=1104775 RepID=UPI00140AEB28|nr:hybrid sensor histidine kinase/response regulator [Lysobacter telluris]
MNDDAHRVPSQVPRWLALAAAGGATLALAMETWGIAGPWKNIALLLAALAVLAIAVFVLAARRREKVWLQTDARARRGEATVDQLQREIDRHTQLEQQLLLAKQAAESAVLAKGEFLATMSHEIRTPLNGIVPMLDLLMHARLAPDHHELVRTALASSHQLLRIVDDILDYSKLEADKLELETTAFNLRELMESVIQLMERAADSKGLRLNLQIDPAVRLPVRGDPVRLRQVLGNLVGNAVKFTERGTVTVTVRRVGETGTQHQLHFEVRDTGIGISAEAQARLFHAFSQADASTTRLYGGTGLGLAICKRIVDLMGGRIEVQSEAGRGATFSFDVPLLKVQGDMPARELSFDGGRLLLLSADARLRTRLNMLLPNWGLRITLVENTQEALDRLRAAATQGPPWAYSVVLADLAGMRNTALALHRNLERHAVYGEVRLVCLYGDEPVPDELRRNVTLLSRQAPDPALREALTSKPAAPAPVAVAVAEPGEGGSDGKSSVHSARVLLVEDNPVNLMVGQRLLSVLGVDCDTAQNGEVALLRMSGSRYDLVLMDCQMPVVDGYTATRRWREAEDAAGDGNHLPIIAMTANAMAGDRQKCLDAGMDDYLAKPVTRAELERCLHRWWRPRAQDMHPLARPLPGTGSAPAPEPQPAPPAAAVPEAPIRSPAEAVGGAVDNGAHARTPEPDASAAAAVAMPGTATRSNDPVLDQAILGELRSVLGAELDKLIALFLDDTPLLLARLEAAALAPDFNELREAAHSLKSSSANLGAMALSAAAKRVELGARMLTLDRPAVAVALIASEFAHARRALLASADAPAAGARPSDSLPV